MQEVLDFYTQSSNNYIEKCTALKQKLRLLSLGRLASFIGLIAIPYLVWNTPILVVIAAFLLGLLFLFLVRYYEDVKTSYRFNHFLLQINQKEIRALKYDLSGFSSGKEYFDVEHAYSNDLDLFGESSLYQYINRATLKEGRDKFSELLLSNNIKSIEEKQKAVQELARKKRWRQEFGAQAMFVEDHIPIPSILKWLKGYKNFVPKSMGYLPWLFLSVFLLTVVLSFKDLGLLNLVVVVIVIGLGITGLYFGRIKQLAGKADKAKSTFKQYAKLLQSLEKETFESKILREQQQLLKIENKKASQAIAGFSRLLDVMDYNNNVFYAIFGNGCFLGALRTAYQIEKWIFDYKDQVGDWFQVVAFFEAYNSLGNFSFNHPQHAFPQIRKTDSSFSAKELGHPLIEFDKNVRNDFGINLKDFHIITGSNMAGKSTFLRSVGLGIVMANMGLPICAKSCSYQPIKLVTSMRSMDSLQKGDSYFLSELKRLKKVINLVREELHFVLLDEILRGTNSLDKAMGSKQILARLIKENATGLIATHDLSLCDTAESYPNVANYHLDATIENGELSFDYRLKEGVSKTMNASFMLKKMNLI